MERRKDKNKAVFVPLYKGKKQVESRGSTSGNPEVEPRDR